VDDAQVWPISSVVGGEEVAMSTAQKYAVTSAISSVVGDDQLVVMRSPVTPLLTFLCKQLGGGVGIVDVHEGHHPHDLP
jgi:hypothetical protein